MPAGAGAQLLATDKTTLPALTGILSTVDDETAARLRVFVEVPSADFAVGVEPSGRRCPGHERLGRPSWPDGSRGLPR
ncbi:NADPH-dependent ferric siderophore reductase [Crossiella equi]|uniref:NADPH-dependent ferric siderophore reductase n=1 Tax=Crossiella equi TaxID=130796 RepID=A0ABS5AUE7_9PSEU|nr:hypothetical protein [Crossiella equi]MBP2479320.1 NADPH-dependent ferric siderophore reductase [Crossiella equi]